MRFQFKHLTCLICMIWLFSGQATLRAQELAFSPGVDHFDLISGANDQVYLQDALDRLSSRYNVFFTYDVSVVKDVMISPVKSSSGTLEKDLKKLLNACGLIYQQISTQNYVIFERSKSDQKEAGVAAKVTMLDQRDFTSASSGSVEIALYSLDRVITGVITDAKDGVPLTGANVVVKGTSIGTVTDLDGSFEITVPDDQNVLVISYTGYATQEVSISNQNLINVALVSEIEQLGEVVITALGIQKEAKKLGYATSNVSADEINVNRSSNFMNTLQGKIAGVNISSLGTGPGGTSKVRIRGQSSISGQNNPLIVVNGIPIDNTNFGTNPGNNGADGSLGATQGGVTSD